MSARIGASNEPERPSAAASTLDPVLEDESQTDTSMTALAEPEPEQIETLEGELEAGPVEAGPAEAVSAEAGQPAEAEPSGSTMIVFEDVQKVYEPHVVALDGVSFTIDKGEFVFVVGASGSGKSTVVRLILKELDSTQGRIIVGGRDLGRLKRSKVPLLRRKVLNMVGLAHKMNSRPEELSGGEQQRVSIARAFVNHPPLLVCDEPTGNLDPDTSVGIMQLLYRINRTGTTILMVTHDREMVDKMRKRVIALEEGKLVRDERRGGYGAE